MFKVLIDPGHGGSDPGATYKTTHEADLNLELSNKLAIALAALGASTDLTRKTDIFVSLKDRVKHEIVYQSTLFVSMHCNAFANVSARGFEVLYYKDASTSSIVAKEIVDCVKVKFPLHGTGLVVRKDLYVLKNTTCPAILIENFFVTNASDRIILSSDTEKDQLITIIAKAIWDAPLSH